MSSAAKANRNQDSEEMEGKESEQKPEAAKPLDFSDFADATEMSPVMQRIYEKMGNMDLAVESYQKAVQLDPDFQIAINNLQRLGR